MGQIVIRNQVPVYCNLAAIQSGGSKANQVLANGEIWLVDTTNASKTNGTGEYDAYIKGDGSTAAKNLTIQHLTAQVDLSDYIQLGETFGTGDDTAASFNSYSDTVWNKQQTLSLSQQEQVRNNIGAAAQNNTFTKGEITSMFEALNGNDVVITEDHTSVSSPASNTIYREQGTNSYTDWMYDGGWKDIVTYSFPGMDNAPTENSNNLVKSSGVYAAINTLDEQLNGVDDENYDVTVTATAGTSIKNTTKYDVGLLVTGKQYTMTLETTNVTNLQVYFYDANGTAVQALIGVSSPTTATNTSLSPSVTTRRVTPLSDIAKIAFYAASSAVTESGDVTVSFFWESNVHGKLAEIDANIQELDESVGTLTTDIEQMATTTSELDTTINGIEDVNVDFTVDFTEGTAVSSNTRYECSFSAGSYIGTVTIDEELISDAENGTLTVYFRDANDALIKQLSFSSKLTSRKITLSSDCVTIYFYIAGSKILGDGSFTFNMYQESSNIGLIREVEALKNNESEGISIITPSESKDYTSAYLAKELIKSTRPYYFNDSYATESSYVDTSYLDRVCSKVPLGKHFIFNTDSHIDYAYTSSQFSGSTPNIGYAQKETLIMKYVRERLAIKNVVFGGDCIGGDDSKYKAAKILAYYCNDKFNAFGSDFIFCMGNHDLNIAQVENQGADREEALISDYEGYKRTTYLMEQYGKAVFDEEGVSVIDNVVENPLTNDEKTAIKAWMKMHYYYDDEQQKIRYIVLESGDSGDALYKLGNGNIGIWQIGHVYTDFIADALINIPENYDVVVIAHQVYKNLSTGGGIALSGAWCINLQKIMQAYKKKIKLTLKNLGGSPSALVTEIVKLRSENNVVSRTFDFSKSKGSGRIIHISGHYHYDDAYLIQTSGSNAATGDECGNNPTVTDDSILYITFDRCCGVGRSSSISQGNVENKPHAVSYPNQGTEEGAEERLGTVNEVLFDVVTITDDNRVVCTRFGGGSDREYNIPIYDSNNA